jgi:hypothetical protein
VFNNATVRGVVCACGGGNIGGFTIGTNMICSSPAAGCSVGVSSCATSGAVAFWAGCSTVGSAPFRVTNTGNFYATSGNISGFVMDSTGLVASGVCGDYSLYGYVGNPTSGNAPAGIASYKIKTTTPTFLACASVINGGMSTYYNHGGTGVSIVRIGGYNLLGLATTTAIMEIQAIGASYVSLYTNGCIHAAAFCTPSDRNMKTDFQSVSILCNLRQLPITKWRFKDSKNYQIGPMAQDFNEIFKLNHDWQTNLTVGGLDGIALKAIKEVDENVQAHDKCIADLKQKLQKLECEMAAIREMIN